MNIPTVPDLPGSQPSASAGDSADMALAGAYRALDQGDAKGARELAQSVLIASRSEGQRRLQAEALTCLAQCDHISSRLRRSADTARRAAQIFESLNDTDGEARALTTFAHVCMLLGRIDEAYEAALLAQRLSEMQGPSRQLVIAHTTLGIASCWAGNFERAHSHLETAVVVGSHCTPLVSGYQARLNQAWVEAARLVDERYRTGRLGSLERFAWMVREFSRLETGDHEQLLTVGLAPMTRTHIVRHDVAAGDMAGSHRPRARGHGCCLALPAGRRHLVGCARSMGGR